MKKRAITRKQAEFVHELLENAKTPTEAALEVYDANSSNSAHVIAYENLQKPVVLSYMQKKYDKINLKWWNETENIKKSIAFDAEKAKRETTRLRAKELLASTHGMFIDRKVIDTRTVAVIEHQQTLSEQSVDSLVHKLTDVLLNNAEFAIPENEKNAKTDEKSE